jgi:hypothetical protein
MTFRGALGALGAGAGMGFGLVLITMLPAQDHDIRALGAVLAVFLISSLVGWVAGFLLGALLDGAKRLIAG